jgi:catechol 2,3-dioxygenase-like lactoylglutathione lyase family enzyme
MRVDVVFACLAVAELDPALSWYERLLGRVPDLIPNAQEAAWQLAPGGWIYVVCDPPRAGHSVVTLIVGDLDRLLADLGGRGIACGRVEHLEAARKAYIVDPAGNTIAFAQPDQHRGSS